ncbi:hypothetical protein EVG20_g10301 [Dentipellis fragilis]|uniref:Microbial-type PARG catalytic domain-containing protein n=1 Tax=Dentipellis fragilis TaxID=205917 RepID=A0A4Y9XTC0_9AGAM|nr:hypothetical protein EVG20_g10301 [Dentipellis fragilis]
MFYFSTERVAASRLSDSRLLPAAVHVPELEAPARSWNLSCPLPLCVASFLFSNHHNHIHKYQATPTNVVAMTRSNTTSKRSALIKARAHRSSPSSHLTHAAQLKPAQAQQKRASHFQHAAVRAKRSTWALIAAQTAAVVAGDGKYVETRRCRVRTLADVVDYPQRTPALSTWHIVHDISSQVCFSREHTAFYPHETAVSVSAPSSGVSVSTPEDSRTSTAFEFSKHSALTVARRLYHTIQRTSTDIDKPTTIGVLSSASPRHPGGGFLNGSSDLESIISRSTSLPASLSTPQAIAFYADHKLYAKEHGVGFFADSVVYSPSIVGLRRDDDDRFDIKDDDFNPEMDAIPADPTTAELEQPPAVNAQNQKPMGEYVAPYLMNVVSAVPVYATSLRANAARFPTAEIEESIRKALKTRMARILRVFQANGDRVLVLPAFGCSEGASVASVARIWAELLACPPSSDEDSEMTGAFHDVFDKVVFALPKKLAAVFGEAWEMRVFEAKVEGEMCLEMDEED